MNDCPSPHMLTPRSAHLPITIFAFASSLPRKYKGFPFTRVQDHLFYCSIIILFDFVKVFDFVRLVNSYVACLCCVACRVVVLSMAVTFMIQRSMISSKFIILLTSLLLITVDAYKFLLYAPTMGKSRATYIGKTAEILIQAGHQVTMLMPVADSRLAYKWADGAKLIMIPQNEEGKALERQEDELFRGLWQPRSFSVLFQWFRQLNKSFASLCTEIINDEALMAQLKAENFDVGYGDMVDFCGAGIFHLLGINKTALALSAPAADMYALTGVPNFPSFVPGIMATYSDQMSFFERLHNFVFSVFMTNLFPVIIGPTQTVFNDKYPNFPSLMELQAQTSLVFINTDHIADFPRPTSHKLIEIGGITIEKNYPKMNETWDEVLNLRPQTVFLSFGSVAKSYFMPEEYKNTIRNTFRKFPNVTFIWKYEKPEDKIGEGIDNIVTTTWAPQVNLLHDPRLSLFITHCGAGSTAESNMAGVPRIVIPVMADQDRNAQVVRKNEAGLVLKKSDLQHEGPLEEALREVLGNPKYLRNARRIAAMLARKPFTVKETFVRNMEFLAEFGPLRYLDQHGQQLSFVQFYLIDVIIFLIIAVLITLYATFKVTKYLGRKAYGYFCSCYKDPKTNGKKTQ